MPSPVAQASATDDLFPRPLRLALPYCALGLATLLAYVNCFGNGFLFDDDLLIQLDTHLRSWTYIGDIVTGSTTSGAHIAGGFYRPLQIFIYLVLFQLGSGSTFAFHLFNLALHAANGCLVYRLGTKLKFNAMGGFIASLVWILHPLHTEAVTYMSATADPLFAFFCLLSVITLLPNIEPRRIWLSLPFFLLGLISKETTVMLPLLVMACLFYISPKRLDWRTYLRTWPLWIITVTYSLWRMHDKSLDGPQTYARLYQLHAFATLKLYADHPLYRLYTFFATLPAYLKLMFVPTGLHMERAFSVFTILFCPPVLVGILVAALGTAEIGFAAARPGRGLPLAWGLLWFLAAHAPDSGILIPMNSLFLEHWMYLPTVGLFLGAAETLYLLLRDLPKPYCGTALGSAAGLACAFALTMGCMTYDQNKVWHDAESFYGNIFKYGERSARAHNNLALYYSDKGNFGAAIEQFKDAIDISDSYAETRHNLALTYLRMPDQPGNLQAAIDNLNHALTLDPNFYRSYQTLGDIYAATGQKEKGDAYHARARELIGQR
jgi:tetratricopeptide (TPR) repeat protein